MHGESFSYPCSTPLSDVPILPLYYTVFYMQVMSLHLMHHIVQGIEWFGPVYGTWMFPYERFNSWMCRRALNRAHPEATIIETYRVSKLMRTAKTV